MGRREKKYPMGFHLRLVAVANKRGLTEMELAEGVGVGRSTMRKWLDGDSAPDALDLARLCLILDISADYLLFGRRKSNGI